MEIEKRFLNVPEVARYLGFGSSTIRKWVRMGMIPYKKINGGIRFDIQIVDKWVNKNSC